MREAIQVTSGEMGAPRLGRADPYITEERLWERRALTLKTAAGRADHACHRELSAILPLGCRRAARRPPRRRLRSGGADRCVTGRAGLCFLRRSRSPDATRRPPAPPACLRRSGAEGEARGRVPGGRAVSRGRGAENEPPR